MEEAKDLLHTIFTTKLGSLLSFKGNIVHLDLYMFRRGDSNMMHHPKGDSSSRRLNNTTKGSYSNSRVRENSMWGKSHSNSYSNSHCLSKNSRITNIAANTCVQKVSYLNTSLSNKNTISTTEVNKYSSKTMGKTMEKKKAPTKEDLQ